MTVLVEQDPARKAALESGTRPGQGDAPEIAGDARNVDIKTALRLIETLPDLVVLDVRMPVEYSGHRLRKSINLDFYSDDFEQQLARLDRQASYLVYCRSGGRSAFTMEIMNELGFVDFVHMPEGIEGWIEAGLPYINE